MSSSEQRLRIIDANLNRAGEGLHLLEELARLTLNDSGLTQQLKTLRHDLLRGDLSFNQLLIQARDSSGDVGVNAEVPDEDKRRGLPTVLVANARRVQESLRILEELAKVPGDTVKLDPDKFKQARFTLYTIEQKLLSRLLRRDKIVYLSGLYAIIDSQFLGNHSYLEVAKKLIRGGARVIQLRDKLLSKGELLPVAVKLQKLCSEHDVLFIINDYLEIALAAGADGLHIGQKDLPVSVARKLLPVDKILGISVTTLEQATTAESEGVDYIAVGSMYPTASKETAIVVGIERLSQIRKAVSLPLVAIGGINKNNAAEVITAGADGVAVISAVLQAGDITKEARQIAGLFEVKN